jgi:tetratricopeptide (TPR) repeat protein
MTAPAPAIPERPSPPALGLESLTDLPEAGNPARGASLELAQEGRRAWMNHDPADARQKLQSALQIWGNNPYAHYYLGMLELEAGHYAQATAFAKSAVRNLRQNPFWNARAYLLLSETMERSGNRQGALEAKIRAFDLDPRVELR